jgi:hypothetical protein
MESRSRPSPPFRVDLVEIGGRYDVFCHWNLWAALCCQDEEKTALDLNRNRRANAGGTWATRARYTDPAKTAEAY